MLVNAIWFLLIACGVCFAGAQGKIDTVTRSAVLGAEAAVILSFKLIGVMCLWLGIMKIAEESGIVRALSKGLAPLIRFLFPSIPAHHPAIGAIVLMLSANLLGLGNAVTPLGIKAMQELQKLNPERRNASAAMCTLVVIAAAGFTLVPATVIALRFAAGSTSPTEIVGVTFIVGLTATAGVLLLDILARFWTRKE